MPIDPCRFKFEIRHVLTSDGRPMSDGPAWQESLVWTITRLSDDAMVMRYSRSVSNEMLAMDDAERHFGSTGTVELKALVKECD